MCEKKRLCEKHKAQEKQRSEMSQNMEEVRVRQDGRRRMGGWEDGRRGTGRGMREEEEEQVREQGNR